MQRFVFPAFLFLSVGVLGAAACDKKSAAGPDEASDVVRAMDNAEGKKRPDKGATGANAQAASAKPSNATPASNQPVSREPIPGVSLDGLDEAKTNRFYKLVASLQSPCGKAHSLRKSVTEDESCKRAPFAVRYVVALLDDEANDSEVKQLYELHYKSDAPTRSFALAKTPHSGPPDAPVQLVEFYDYGCGACKQFAPILKEVLQAFPDQAVLYYKQFPLPGHPNSKPAAQAVLAASKQGKFDAMHELLFARSPQHRKSELLEYAKALGLDMARFQADFDSSLSTVQADVAEGDAAGVKGTPTLYINGKIYEGPAHPRYIKMWIEEELAVNR